MTTFHSRCSMSPRTAADAEFSAEHLQGRLRQFFDETYRFVPRAADALARGALDEFGEIVAGSQQGAERALENQIPETMNLVRIARELGAVASSAFGAGFGGSVWAMVPVDGRVERFISEWRDRYSNAHRGAETTFAVLLHRAKRAGLRVLGA